MTRGLRLAGALALLGPPPAAAQPLGPDDNPVGRCACTCVHDGPAPPDGTLRQIFHYRIPGGVPARCAEYDGTLCPGIYAAHLPHSYLRGCRAQLRRHPGTGGAPPGAPTAP